jgi:hypothetical protein
MGGVERPVQIFSMRAMYSGAAFHRAYPGATQQAFFEAHEHAFAFFRGVFGTLRYDNLSSAVKRVLRGHFREETTRFIAFRSHWRFDASFCTPSRGNERGGVEGEVGYFRRNHLVPIPKVVDFDELNELLLAACVRDQARVIAGRACSVGDLLAEECFPRGDFKGCVRVRTNFYSTPLPAGVKAHVHVFPTAIEVWRDGRLVARHARSYERYQHVLDLEHYLDVLSRKPGALKAAEALRQWREQDRWPASYDRLWHTLTERFGRSEWTRELIGLLGDGKTVGYDRLTGAVEQTLAFGCTDPSAVRYVIRRTELDRPETHVLEVEGRAALSGDLGPGREGGADRDYEPAVLGMDAGVPEHAAVQSRPRSRDRPGAHHRDRLGELPPPAHDRAPGKGKPAMSTTS